MRRSLLSTLAALALASPAAAGAPTPAWCTMPTRLSLVGTNAGVPDPRGAATWVIRRFGNPVTGSRVVLDFSSCADVTLSGDGLLPGQLLDCSMRRVQGFTDMTGTVTFHVVGAGAGAARALPACLKVYADGMPLSSPVVSVFDLDGRNGVDPLDVATFASDFFSGQYRPRCDYDGDGDVDGLDLAAMAGAVFGGGSTASGTFCP